MRKAKLCGLGFVLALGACDDAPERRDPILTGQKMPEPEELAEPLTDQPPGIVADYMATACTTRNLMGLAQQIAEEINCTAPGTFVRFEKLNYVNFTGAAVLLYFAPAAAFALQEAASEASGISVVSGFRTLPQQFLLHHWKENSRCSVTTAAPPGTSNHESGRAVDIREWNGAKVNMARYGWVQNVEGDDPHFEHLASPDLRASEVQVFQRLWNRNHADMALPQDGTATAETLEAVKQAPGAGFHIGPCGRIWVDNHDRDNFSTTGPWRYIDFERGYWGSNYLLLRSGDIGSVTWLVKPPKAGRYELIVNVVPGGNRTAHATYTVLSAKGKFAAMRDVDQWPGGPISLGVFDLTETAQVTLDAVDPWRVTVADLLIAVPQ